ncbi:protease inhibitor I9 family protein [Streptomyces sp. NPDC058695]|uniref:protease inhibitor I9 family protein n=1 Tax=Streptomyces sp. NPDC058695 TaxID=3346604 RepID=UPI00364DBEC9
MPRVRSAGPGGYDQRNRMNRLGRGTALSLSGLLLSSLAGLPLHTAAAAEDERGYVVVLKDSVADPKAAASRQTRAYGGSGATVVYRHALKGYAATMAPAQATALEKDPQVRFVAAQRTYKVSPPPQPSAGPASNSPPSTEARTDGPAVPGRSGSLCSWRLSTGSPRAKACRIRVSRGVRSTISTCGTLPAITSWTAS